MVNQLAYTVYFPKVVLQFNDRILRCYEFNKTYLTPMVWYLCVCPYLLLAVGV